MISSLKDAEFAATVTNLLSQAKGVGRNHFNDLVRNRVRLEQFVSENSEQFISVFDDNKNDYVDVDVVTRDDGGVLHNILSQVDFNKSEYTKHRRNAMKIMKALRRWNFDHSRKEIAIGCITIEEGQLEFINDEVVKDNPKDIKLFGLNALE